MRLLKKFSSAFVIVAMGAVGTFAGVADAAFPSTIAQNSSVGNTYGSCAVAIQMGYFGSVPYAQIMDYGSGSGCNLVSVKVSYFPSNGGPLVTKSRSKSSPPDYTWYQAVGDGAGTIFNVEVLQESNGGCWYKTLWSPNPNGTMLQYSNEVANGCSQP